MARFFMAGTNLLGGTAIIRGKDAEHIRVLRIRPGEEVIINDTQGTDYRCRMVSSTPEEAEVEVVEAVPCKGEPSVKVSVYCGLPKGSDRTDYIIQKSVESGAEEIVFFRSDRCVAKLENAEKKLARWNSISEAAAQQSGRGMIPKVRWLGTLAEVFDEAVKKDLALFMYETGERESLSDVLKENAEISSCAIITGPEGGFAEFEAKLAKICSLRVCSMGERIYRCETAPVVAITAVMYETGNLS